MRQTHTKYRNDGTILAVGYLKDGQMDGYWKWYRKDGTKLKTGFFTDGKRTKDWMKYDKTGKLIKAP